MVGRDVTSCFVSSNLFLHFVLFVPSASSCFVYCDWIHCLHELVFSSSVPCDCLSLTTVSCNLPPPYPDGEAIELSSGVSPTIKSQCDSLLLLLLPWLAYGSSHSLRRKKRSQARAIYISLELSPTQPARYMLCVWARPLYIWNTVLLP